MTLTKFSLTKAETLSVLFTALFPMVSPSVWHTISIQHVFVKNITQRALMNQLCRGEGNLS